MSFQRVYDIAGSALQAQTSRMNTVASNLANAGSVAASEEEAYRAIKPVFATVYQQTQAGELAGAGVNIAGVLPSDRQPEQRYQPDHPLANDDGNVYYAGVNVMEEMADMMSASRSFESAVEVIGRVNSMQQGLLNLGQR
ncbi:flagellar basal body rod protein FlgC [Oceanimonas baumannii]|uniref:Flagellar basal-body rod protein FlgC n=1 Tax=Oceanimonas baumannii TaxID=129578 RepID=A0A235CMJ9_9GAMM|nr:flagellar basal body rod protein FlgC [Oceanimonas baumannii]OYD25782.1 flagellar basal body rod protein FlgC [Oceanimonas baumannii]TDW60210.1 flagellar basal-body rod protein FlgC [Oceanimonas baumannii]